MKKIFLIPVLFGASLGILFAQESVQSKTKFGVTLSTNIYGIKDDLNNVSVGGGIHTIRKITNRFSIYSEIIGSSRDYGDLSLLPGSYEKFTTGILAIYIAPMIDIGKNTTLSLGLVDNHLFRSKLKTATGSKDVKDEIKNYSSLFFDIRHQISKKITLGTRYEWGLNSMMKTTDRKVTTISLNTFVQFGRYLSEEKSK